MRCQRRNKEKISQLCRLRPGKPSKHPAHTPLAPLVNCLSITKGIPGMELRNPGMIAIAEGEDGYQPGRIPPQEEVVDIRLSLFNHSSISNLQPWFYVERRNIYGEMM